MNNSKFKIVSGAIVLSTLVVGLSACGGGGSSTKSASSAAAGLTSINGKWRSECEASGNPGVFGTIEFDGTDGSATRTVRTFSDSDCSAQTGVEASLITYTLGSDVTVNGSVEGITTATQLDHTDGGTTTTFDIVAIKGSLMFTGNTDAAATDGSTAAKRATQLDPDEKFINTTAALTTIAGTWKTACTAGGPTAGLTVELVATNTGGTFTVEFFSDAACNTPDVMPDDVTAMTYTLGDAVGVDGSAEGITIATKVDTNDGTPEFDLVAIKGSSLYFGDTDAAATDGSTPEKRAKQLQAGQKFVKQ